MSLLQDYQRWIANARAAGQPLAGYSCPHCGQAIETLRPSPDVEPFDSLTTCPHCQQLHFKVVWSNGRVQTTTGTGAIHTSQEVTA